MKSFLRGGDEPKKSGVRIEWSVLADGSGRVVNWGEWLAEYIGLEG